MEREKIHFKIIKPKFFDEIRLTFFFLFAIMKTDKTKGKER